MYTGIVVAHFREPSGTSVAVRNLRVTMMDVNARPPQPTLARKFLNESVSLSASERNTSLQIGLSQFEVVCTVYHPTILYKPTRCTKFL